jgi:hypothetical protein
VTFPAWTVGLTGSRYEAARALHAAATPPSDAHRTSTALARAHAAGLSRDELTAILRDARPTITDTDLARAVRTPRIPPRALHDLHDEDGPGWAGPYAELCIELRRRHDTQHLDLLAVIETAAVLAAGIPDQDLACLIACAHLIVLGATRSTPEMLGYRFQLACRLFHEAAA